MFCMKSLYSIGKKQLILGKSANVVRDSVFENVKYLWLSLPVIVVAEQLFSKIL